MNNQIKQNHPEDISIVLAGAAGQGIQTIEHILTRILRKAGYNVFSSSEFMSRIRGGSNSTQIRISSHKIAAFVDRIDIFIPLDNNAVAHCQSKISPDTKILADKEIVTVCTQATDTRLSKIAKDLGNALFANSVAVGIISGLFNIPFSPIQEYLELYFSSKAKDIIDKNIAAAQAGIDIGKEIISSKLLSIDIQKDPLVSDDFFMTGADAVAIGALAGGCNFVSSYPMSPSTNVLQFLAEHKNEFGIVVEQAEDEIAAVNMALGAWYAGGRGFVTTSGGGFALMCEGISLAGMIETPVVVHVGQRPGPATGLPTRTEQGDLELVLYSGHGEFPRAIFAPGTISEAIKITHKAFDVADRYQLPTFILTDQFFLDSSAASLPFDLSELSTKNNIVKTEEDYKRYALTENGISPRGIPGHGNGIVCVDSDEHTDQGYITEDAGVRTTMMDKRLKKLDLIAADCIEPQFTGKDTCKTLVICWGANFACVQEALSLINDDSIGMLHFSQVYPLHKNTTSILNKASNLIIVENNATAQFAMLLHRLTGIVIHEKILKYNGSPFSVEELVTAITAILQ